MDSNLKKMPNGFYCPILHTLMEDPYITKISGISYEKTAIMEWLTKNNTCPITRIPLTLEMLQPNRALKDSIETIKAQFGDAIVKKICVSESITNVTSIYDGNDLMVSVKIPDVLHRTSKELCIAIDTSGSTGVNVTILNEQGSSETYNLTILDLLIHAAKTLINCLENYDYLSIVSYSTHAKIVIERKLMTDTNKKLAIDAVENMYAEGCTNIWDALDTSIELVESDADIVLLTDGLPNMNPPRGIMPMLIKKKDTTNKSFCISTFGFGYQLDSKLLVDIAREGNGTYNFIPDSGFIGTVFEHYLANFLTTKFSDLRLKIELDNIINKDEIIMPYNFTKQSWGIDINLGSLRYGQSKDIVIPIKFNKEQLSDMKFQISYTDPDDKKIINIDHSDIILGKDVNIIRNKVRQEFIHIIHSASIEYTCGHRSEAQTIISDFINKVILIKQNITETYKNDDIYIQAIINDLKGQITEAFSKDEWFEKWGRHYLPSICMAYEQQLCNNFKDFFVQHFGGKLFHKIRDHADDIFCNMPAPKPQENYQDVIYRGGSITPQPISMNVFSQSSGPCFEGNCIVLMKNNRTKKVQDIRQGDIVQTPNNGNAKVICVTKTICKKNKTLLVEFESGLKITPYHPIRLNEIWKFPINIKEPSHCQCSAVYNFVLENNHIMIINSIECVTLGHNFKGDVIGHPYYGSRRVICDLKKSQTWPYGIVVIHPDDTIRDPDTNIVSGLNVY